MANASLPYQIREVPDPEGGLHLELLIEGERVASATAGRDVLDAMHQLLDLSRDDVATELQRALTSYLKHQLDKVVLLDVQETDPLRFEAAYTYRDADSILTGLAWYDVNESQTGPEEVPAIVRNQLRYEVHRRLTGEGSHARKIVDLNR